MVTIPPRPADLPDFQQPPVDEVVLGVEFAPLQGFSQAHLGILWNEIRDRYPRTEDQPPLVDAAVLSAFPFQPFGQHPGSGFRTWFISDDDQYVLQVQNDRLLHNWRRRTTGIEYPRFEPLFQLFYDHLQRFQDVLQGLGLEPLVPRQIEVSYINWITDMQAAEFFVPANVAVTTSSEVTNQPRQLQWAAQYGVQVGGGPEGGLAVICNPAMRPPPQFEQGYQLMLTLKIPIVTTEGLAELMAVGRNIIVRTFTDLTTEEGHRRWIRIQ